MLSGLGDKAGAQIVERGHVVEQHAAGAVGSLNLNADLAADDAAEITGWQAAVEPEKAGSSSRDRPESIHAGGGQCCSFHRAEKQSRRA